MIVGWARVSTAERDPDPQRIGALFAVPRSTAYTYRYLTRLIGLTHLTAGTPA